MEEKDSKTNKSRKKLNILKESNKTGRRKSWEEQLGMKETDERKVHWLRVKGDRRKEDAGSRRKDKITTCLRTGWKRGQK